MVFGGHDRHQDTRVGRQSKHVNSFFLQKANLEKRKDTKYRVQAKLQLLTERAWE